MDSRSPVGRRESSFSKSLIRSKQVDQGVGEEAGRRAERGK